MQKLRRAWIRFFALPWIVRFGLCLGLAIVAMLLVPTGAEGGLK